MSGSLTDPAAPQSAIQFPSARLLAGGNVVPGLKAVSITSNNYYQADRFHATVVPIAGATPDAAWWCSQTDIRVEFDMSIGFPGVGDSGWQKVLTGLVDRLTYNPGRGEVHLEGRDLSALLIDAKTQNTYANKTSSQIATLLAQEHGLTPVVTATSTPVGQYYQLEHDRIQLNNFSRQTTEWDLLTYLAGIEGYDLFVTGQELHFQPTAQPGDQKPFTVNYAPGSPNRLTVLDIQLQRSLTLAKDIQVTVKTWNSRHKTAYTRTVKGATSGATQHGGQSKDVQQYVFVKPNLTPDAALQFAQQKLKELSLNERVVTLEMPATLAINPRSMIQVAGTSTSFDQTYFICEIERSLDFRGGLRQRVRAKNTSPRQQTTVL